jgi:hypothetical protein
MPLNEMTPSATTPSNSPASTRTSAGACETTVVGTPTAAASAASDPNRSLLIRFAGIVIIAM